MYCYYYYYYYYYDAYHYLSDGLRPRKEWMLTAGAPRYQLRGLINYSADRFGRIPVNKQLSSS